MIADILIPIPATALITLMGEKHGVLLGELIGTPGSRVCWDRDLRNSF